jgi:hypothetical protein
VRAGFEDGLKAKLNLLPDPPDCDCEPGPVGGGLLGVARTSTPYIERKKPPLEHHCFSHDRIEERRILDPGAD